MAVDTHKRNRRQNAWQKQNTDRINFVMPKGYRKAISEAAEICGTTSSEFIRRAIERSLQDCNITVKSPLHSSADVIE